MARSMLRPPPIRQGSGADRWARWGPKVTICLSSFSHPDRSIVNVSDRMMTMGNTTAENSALKWYAIHRDWHVEFAGDAGIACRIMQRAIPSLDPARTHTALAVGE